jgi:hypothetical protein
MAKKSREEVKAEVDAVLDSAEEPEQAPVVEAAPPPEPEAPKSFGNPGCKCVRCLKGWTHQI